MEKINFTKIVASGNDFVVIESGHKAQGTGFRVLAQKICNRKFAVGADGLLVIEKSNVADIKMRVFNSDGSEAEMCGNGARCVALYISRQSILSNSPQKRIKIETKAGIIDSEVDDSNVRIKLTDPTDIKLDISIKINNRDLVVNFINTGVPHTVVFVEGLDKIDVFNLGSEIRYHKKFAPAGTNVDFVEVLSNDALAVRTYERGVEDETLACGTGVVASALITDYRLRVADLERINVKTQSGETLKVYFERAGSGFKNVWLEGEANIVYKGEYNV